MTIVFPLLLLMATSTNMREFHFVPYGSTFTSPDSHRPTISCDGRIEGTSLELTHWTGNETPDSFYADTSTEMALKFAQHPNDEYKNAYILNNHYDSDGVLSVFACLEPKLALEYASLLQEGAEAGDFGEWSSDNGIKLNYAIESFLEHDEESAYQTVLNELPGLLQDLSDTGGESYQERWQHGFQEAVNDWKAIQQGKASLKRGPGKMVVVKEPPDHYLSPYALNRGLVQSGLNQGTTRILRCLVSSSDDNNTFRYRYEMPGYAWVKKLVTRQAVPAVVDGAQLVRQLGSDCWKRSGSMIGICDTTRPIETPPEEVASLLHKLDDGCQ